MHLPLQMFEATRTATHTEPNRGGRKAAKIPLPRRSTLLSAMERERKRVKLSNLPFDILGEVCMRTDPSVVTDGGCGHSPRACPQISDHLHPRDLLNLALTSRSIAGFLLNRHQEYIWRNARLRTPNLPQLPPFMHERGFARFLYSHRCNVSYFTCPLRWRSSAEHRP